MITLIATKNQDNIYPDTRYMAMLQLLTALKYAEEMTLFKSKQQDVGLQRLNNAFLAGDISQSVS